MTNDTIWKLRDDAQAHYPLEGNGEFFIYDNVTEEEFNAYISRLSSEKEMKLYANTLFGNQPAYTFLWRDKILHTYFTPKKNCVRLTVEPQSDRFHGLLPQTQAPFEKICDPTFAIMALDFSKQNPIDANGMSYVFRLADGSFIVYDGGYAADAWRLYAYLRDHTPFEDGRIVIAAWILTHSHTDHYSCFREFSRTFSSKVEVKRFLFNSPTKDPVIIKPTRHDAFLNTAFWDYAPQYQGADVVRVHTGQCLRLAGAEIEILQTYEDVLPETMHFLNEASVVTRIQIEGQTFLFPADSEIRGDRALERYGAYLKSDFLQVTHHGYSGGSLKLADAIDPQYIMWPTNFECYAMRTVRTWHNSLNRYLLICKSVDLSFVGDGLCKILTLPFHDKKSIEYYQYPEQ